jgi:hypothetical protein
MKKKKRRWKISRYCLFKTGNASRWCWSNMNLNLQTIKLVTTSFKLLDIKSFCKDADTVATPDCRPPTQNGASNRS